MFCFQCGYQFSQNPYNQPENNKIEENLDAKNEYIPFKPFNLSKQDKPNMEINDLKEIEKKQDSNDRKKQLIVPAIIIVMVFAFIGGIIYNHFHSQKVYSVKISEANRLYSEEKYAEAIGYYEQALNLNNEPSVATKLEECKRLNTSAINYDCAMNCYNSSNKSAYSLNSTYSYFEQVIPEDTKRYQDAQIKKEEIIKQLLQLIQTFYDEGAYGAALDQINWILKLQPDNQKAQELLKPISDARSKEIQAAADQLRAQQKERERQTIEANNQKIVDSNGKQIWKIYIDDGSLHFTATYNGSGNFIVKLSDSNQELIDVIANEIGSYKADRTVFVPYKGWYYLEIYCSHGSWTGNWN